MYNICLLSPDNDVTSHCLAEVALLLRASMRDLGLECSFRVNGLEPDRTNILLGYQLLDAGADLPPCPLIPFQLEQLSDTAGHWSPGAEAVLRCGAEVWDYSEANRAFLRERGIESRLLPLGYHPALERIVPAAEKDIDVLFYGLMNDRRQKVLEELGRRGVRAEALFGVFMEERDRYVARSKIVLNVHYYPMKILETVRVSYLLNNGAFVVSEESDDNPYRECGLVSVPYERLADTCVRFLEHPEEREALAARTGAEFRRRFPMARLLKNILGGRA